MQVLLFSKHRILPNLRDVTPANGARFVEDNECQLEQCFLNFSQGTRSISITHRNMLKMQILCGPTRSSELKILDSCLSICYFSQGGSEDDYLAIQAIGQCQ